MIAKNNALATDNQSSPFDSIRRVDGNGNEFWLARELMPLLGYKTWQKFEDAIGRARSTCLLNGELEANHINHLPGSVSANGRTGDNYQLSRNACYWVVMTSDTRKPEVALAHQYFAVKIREAETAQPAKLPTMKELAYMLIAAEEAREALEAQIAADAPATALGKVIEHSQSQGIRIGDFAKILGDVGQNQYFEELRADGIIQQFPNTLPYQRFISSGYFRVTQVQGKGGASNKWFPVALITPKGQTYLAKRHKKYLTKRDTIRTIEAQVSALV